MIAINGHRARLVLDTDQDGAQVLDSLGQAELARIDGRGLTATAAMPRHASAEARALWQGWQAARYYEADSLESPLWRLRVQRALARFELSEADLVARGLSPVAEPRLLASPGVDLFGRRQWLAVPACSAFLALVREASLAGIELLLVSAFRSLDYQMMLLERRRARGESPAQMFSVNAPPGTSEHHSGRAVDLATPGFRPLQADFENSPAFAWLQSHAADFGFHQSYGRDNPWGFVHEPWHWCFAL